jgi:hypothetical protein
MLYFIHLITYQLDYLFDFYIAHYSLLNSSFNYITHNNVLWKRGRQMQADAFDNVGNEQKSERARGEPNEGSCREDKAAAEQPGRPSKPRATLFVAKRNNCAGGRLAK